MSPFQELAELRKALVIFGQLDIMQQLYLSTTDEQERDWCTQQILDLIHILRGTRADSALVNAGLDQHLD